MLSRFLSAHVSCSALLRTSVCATGTPAAQSGALFSFLHKNSQVAMGFSHTAGALEPTHKSIQPEVAQQPPSDDATYDSLKKAARATGDAAKEWMEGSSTTGSTIYKAAAAGGEELLSATKRAVQDKAEHAKGESVGAGGLREEWAQGKGDTGSFAGFKDTVSKAADAVEQGVEKVKGWAAQATEAVAGVEKEAATPMSARAEWADTRSESLKAKEKESRKSQLTDEAAGDNPAQAVPREERTTTPDEMYTRH